ncbi:hypothetical protein [Roseiconus lacunae]|uniref:hypothetical protein n=1 Tax=Roseiconus lacunae TaxID=2605694 RepID=UPI001E3CCF67|nr:hypothetical protein [Roseiconus lacunae]MCD0459162.1 hypothetical protein [Roseiconus lacunae]
MTVPPHHLDDSHGDAAPGGLLGELERRQDDVLQQLDDLDAKLTEVLRELEPARDEASGEETASAGSVSATPANKAFPTNKLPADRSDAEAKEEPPQDESPEDWA